MLNKPHCFKGSQKDLYQQARYSTEAGVDILAPECAVPLQTPITNLKAIVEAARRAGRAVHSSELEKKIFF